jgi:CheY-like chemotaxis protein
VKEKERPGTRLPQCARPARILVVEDEAIIAMDLAATLRRQGYLVSGTVATGEESIVQAESERPDLVLMDIRLKGRLNGIEAAHEIRRRWGIPVIYLTAYGEETRLERLGESNGAPRLIKPFDDGDLEQILSKYLPAHNN